MSLALPESKNAFPACLPNPPVWCALVINRQVASSGILAPYEYHAEAYALGRCSSPLTRLTAYVTIELFSFHVLTPSCADALIKHGIKSVVVALVDPDSRNNGQGLEKLRKAGVDVMLGIYVGEVSEFLGQHLDIN